MLAILGFEDDAWLQHFNRVISILVGFLWPKQEYAEFAYSRNQHLYYDNHYPTIASRMHSTI